MPCTRHKTTTTHFDQSLSRSGRELRNLTTHNPENFTLSPQLLDPFPTRSLSNTRIFTSSPQLPTPINNEHHLKHACLYLHLYIYTYPDVSIDRYIYHDRSIDPSAHLPKGPKNGQVCNRCDLQSLLLAATCTQFALTSGCRCRCGRVCCCRCRGRGGK